MGNIFGRGHQCKYNQCDAIVFYIDRLYCKKHTCVARKCIAGIQGRYTFSYYDGGLCKEHEQEEMRRIQSLY